MVPLLPLFILAALAYGGASLAHGVSAGAPESRAPRLTLLAAAALHLATIGAQCTHGLHPFKSIFLASSLGALTTVVGYLALSRPHRPLRALGAVLAPVGLVGLTVGVVMGPGAADHEPGAALLMKVHIGAATLGLAGFSLAAGVAGLYLGMERRLRRKIFRPDQQGASLTGLERLHLRLVLAVLPVFTLAIATGAAAMGDEGIARMLEERALELAAAAVAWLSIVTELVARAGWGFRGRRAAWLTMSGFCAVVLIVVWYGVRT